ncbi:MAG: carboxypeptidase-like regulatory domain-containing protein [Gemmatales bacterium]|nr:carboxypeptidase-like regulatory domain-containing protein [Gemmatales bacterium]MDW7993030.1 carboxypeptidase-like regulatory domain-containing protein [Gemmatales bacterium]
MRVGLAVLLSFTLALVATGCGRSSNIVPVSGRVTMDGQPLAEARVTFQPMGDWGNPYAGTASYGVTDQEGRYSLRLVDSDRPGAIVGKHRVTITPKQSAASSSDVDYFKSLPPNQKPQTLEFEVPPTGTTEANFDLVSQ